MRCPYCGEPIRVTCQRKNDPKIDEATEVAVEAARSAHGASAGASVHATTALEAARQAQLILEAVRKVTGTAGGK